MVTLDQVKLLETKVEKAIGYVEKVSGENTGLRERLESYQKRIDELEVLVETFKEDQSRIEDGILSTLDRLNQFEDAIERSLGIKNRDKKAPKAAAPSPAGNVPDMDAGGLAAAGSKNGAPKDGVSNGGASGDDVSKGDAPGDGVPDGGEPGDGASGDGGELDIF
ncbi:MAG: cell division protein ZapB [Treponema sp.]|jgi:hypothetical protein|nr:cell division protein ZapB [Treponema sp.]